MENKIDDLVVVKRSGQRVEYNGLKIAVAIKSAFDDNAYSEYSEKDINKVFEDTTEYIIKNYKDRKTINVEDIQDIIENILKRDNYNDIYQTFSEYRLKRAESRKAFSEKQQHKFVKAIEKIGTINADDEKISSSLLKFGTTLTTEYNKSYILDNKYVRAHDEGKIFIHNLPYFNLGFLNDTHVIIDNYLNDDSDFLELMNFLNNVKDEIHGIIAIDNMDEVLYKFTLKRYHIIYKNYLEKYLNIMGFTNLLNIKKIEDLINKSNSFDIDFSEYEVMNKNNNINNLVNLSKEDSLDDIRNYLSKNLNQLFINLENNGDNAKYNISFGLKSYDFINKIILNEISKLPILKNISFIYKIERDICDDIMETIATLILNGKNIYIESNSNKDYLSNGLLIDEAKGKSNIANVSINIARLGIKYKSLNEEFYKELNESLELTKSALIFIFETIGDKLKDNYQYLFNNNLLDDEKLDYNQHIRKVIKAGTININLVGLKECAMVINSDDYQNTLVELIKAIRIRVNALKDDSKYNFTLSAINQENVSKEMIELDKSVYGNINKVTKKDEYENISLVSNSNLDSELKEFSNYYKAFDGGILTEIVLNKSTSVKHIKEVLNLILDSNIGIVNVQIRGES